MEKEHPIHLLESLSLLTPDSTFVRGTCPFSHAFVIKSNSCEVTILRREGYKKRTNYSKVLVLIHTCTRTVRRRAHPSD